VISDVLDELGYSAREGDQIHVSTSWIVSSGTDGIPRMPGSVPPVPPSVRPAVERYLVQFAYLLNDLSEISDEELRVRAMTAVAKLVALCFKHARTSPDFMAILSRWMDVVREVVQAPNGLSALAQVLCYVLQVSVTAGQLLIEQGVEQGIKQSFQQGEAQDQSAGPGSHSQYPAKPSQTRDASIATGIPRARHLVVAITALEAETSAKPGV